MRYPPAMSAIRLVLVAALVVVAGCSAASSSPGEGSLAPSSDRPGASQPAASGTSGLPATITDPIIVDVAGLAGVAIDGVTLVSAEAVTFPDGSLGCPEPGMAYSQVVTDGYKIVLTAGGKTFDYRGTGPGTFRRCTNPPS